MPHLASKRYSEIELRIFKNKNHLFKERLVNNPEAACHIFNQYLANFDRERFAVLSLNAKNEPLSIEIISIGSINTTIVHPREVFKAAIISNAAKIICAHNHPSNNLQPSNEDKELTIRLNDCAKLIGIEIIDHLIIGSESSYFSFKANKLL